MSSQDILPRRVLALSLFWIILIFARTASAGDLRTDKALHAGGTALCAATINEVLRSPLFRFRARSAAWLAIGGCLLLGVTKEFLIDARPDHLDMAADLTGILIFRFFPFGDRLK